MVQFLKCYEYTRSFFQLLKYYKFENNTQHIQADSYEF